MFDQVHDAGHGSSLPVMILVLNSGGPPPGKAQGVSSDQWRQSFDAMFVNRHFTISLSGQRIENANGERSPDGRRVTWRIPIATAIDPGRETPLTIEADIIYR